MTDATLAIASARDGDNYFAGSRIDAEIGTTPVVEADEPDLTDENQLQAE